MRNFNENRVDNTIHCKWRNLIGRVIYIDGGIGYFTTPHGTIMRSGIAWLSIDIESLTDEERRMTVEYILNARKNGIRYKDIQEKAKQEHVKWLETI